MEGWFSVFSYTLVEEFCDEIDIRIDRALFIGFQKLNFRLQGECLTKVPQGIKVSGGSRKMIKSQLRNNSGIKISTEILSDKRKKNPLLL